MTTPHEQKLRQALEEIAAYYPNSWAADRAKKALKVITKRPSPSDYDQSYVEPVKESLTPEPAPTIEDNSQNWAGMDGATAWQLIERHADNWADIGKMMHEWLDANTPKPESKMNSVFSKGYSMGYKHATIIEVKKGQAATLEPAPMVRLTEDDVATAWNLAHENTISHAQYDPLRFDFNFANAIMDAMIAKNGGKP